MVWNGLNGNGLDPVYRQALTAGHTVYSRLDVVDPFGNVLLSDVPFGTGSIRATLQNRTVRTATLTVPRTYFPVTASGQVDSTKPFAPFGNRLSAYRGIVLGNGLPVYFPIFLGRIETVKLTPSSALTRYPTGSHSPPGFGGPSRERVRHCTL